MKRTFQKLFLLLFVTIIGFSSVQVEAWQTGGYTGSGGATGGGTDINHMTDGGSGFDSGVYLFQLVYKPQYGDYYDVGKCVVVNTGAQGRYIISDIDRKANSTAEANGCRYGSKNGSLLNLARDIQARGGLDNVQTVSEKTYANQLLSEFNQNINNLKEQGSDPGNFNSYGYRILVQKLTCFGYSSWDVNTWCSILYPRKSWAAEHPDLGLFGSSWQGDLFTTQDDMGIHNAAGRRGGWYTTNGRSELGLAFADRNRGEGYNIIGFNPKLFVKPYDYSVDAACVNCNSNDSENKAYIIQDTTDWEAIMNSSSMDGNVKTYFDRGGGTFCREEYKVFFPNVNNTIKVTPGRFFLLNPTARELENLRTTGIQNFKPVRVTKIRQCKGGNLNAYARNAESEFKRDTGTVMFRYNETNSDSPYNMNSAEEMRRYDEPDSYSANINGDMLTMSVTYSYTLPQNYYQYVRKQDGLSMKHKPSNDASELQEYENIGLPNLPVTFTANAEDNAPAGDIQFSYTLPSDSRISKAYTQNNDYLQSSGNKVDNVYKKYRKGRMESRDWDILNNSACAKMFGSSGEAFENCVSQRTGNKIGTGSNSCINRNKIDGATDSGYSCMVLINSPSPCEVRNGKYYYNGLEISKSEYNRICNPSVIPPDEDGDCKTEADANRLGRDWNPKTNSCCPVGTTYNSSTGKCDEETIKCETAADASRLGRDWNPKTKSCCPVGTSYNSKTGKCDDDTDSECKTEADANRLGRDWNPKTNSCCPVGTTYNSSTGKCSSGGTPPTTTDDCKTEADANRLGRDWNPRTKACCPVGTTYNPTTGVCENDLTSCKTEEDANRLGRDWNPTTNKCCPVGTNYNPETGECDGTADGCETEADANRLGRSWNPSTNSCCPVGQVYNSSTGQCKPKNTQYTCRIENGKYYDFSGNQITKEEFYRICPDGGTCYVKDGKYYDFDGKEISKEEYDRICPGTTTIECPTSECPYGCCPSGECAPMPDGTCPGTGGINVIYRPIDLTFPFPGQDGSDSKARVTGANWCSYSISAGRLDCSYDNNVSSNYIINKRSVVYSGDPLYEIVLDTKKIGDIREYNDSTSYDDWDLKCKNNGKACVSDFLNNTEYDVTGLCANSNKSNFYSCDKSKKGSD